MSNITGFYPRIQVDTTNSGAVGQAGGVLLTETIAAAGLGPVMSAALSGWRKPLAVHDPAKVVMDLAVTLALGGDCMAPTSLCCEATRACTDVWPRMRRSHARSPRWQRMPRQCWLPSTPPGPRAGRGRGNWPGSTPRTTVPAHARR